MMFVFQERKARSLMKLCEMLCANAQTRLLLDPHCFVYDRWSSRGQGSETRARVAAGSTARETGSRLEFLGKEQLISIINKVIPQAELSYESYALCVA